MNNYANWEITQLLPIKDEESNYIWFKYNDWWANDKNLHDVYLCKIEETYLHGFDEKCIYLRDGYSWEDIRLYLLSQEIEFFIDTDYGYDKKQYYFKVEIGKYGTADYEYYDSEVHDWLFDTYEQAREEAIKYCLSK